MQLRGFLMLRGADGWNVAVCRDLDAVLDAWRARGDGETGVLHLGFDRPPSDTFNELASCHTGRMLLTGAARYGLPHGFQSTNVPVGDVDGLPVFLATQGFGYVIEGEDFLPPISAPEQSTVTPRGWVGVYVADRPTDAGALTSAGVVDDDSYITNEHLLDRALRQRIGAYRFRHLIGFDGEDPVRIARCAPPWLQSMKMDELPLTVRLTNVVRREQIEEVGELAKFKSDQLLKLNNFGRKSWRDLTSILLDALARGPITDEDAFAAAEAVTMLDGMRTTLARLNERQRDILVRRMGLYGPSETLEQIGESYGITRERIRQIEAKVVRRIIDDDRWDNLLTRKLEALLDNRDHPLPVIGVEAFDPWFTGIADNGQVLTYILETMCGNRFHVVEIDDVPYFATFDQQRWAGCQREARAILKANARAGWDEAHCRAVVSGLLEVSSREFGPLLWDSVCGGCHFAAEGDRRILTSFGRGLDAVVEAILKESVVPLHYSDIAALAAQRLDREVDVRQIHVSAQNVGYLFGRGLYGLEKHCIVGAEIRAACVAECERIVREGPPGRQWTCNELCGLLADEGIEDDGLDKYGLDIFLRQSTSLERLGRLTWTAKVGNGQIVRTDIRKAIVAILREAGGPLATNEIMARLDAVRGTDQTVAIWNFDPVIRLKRGLWGLNDRDVSVSREMQARLFDAIADMISDAGESIHISDVVAALPDINRLDIDADLLGSLAVHHKQVKINCERFFYLPEWGDARRERLSDAIEAVLDGSSSSGLTYEEIIDALVKRMGRSVDSRRVSALLQRVGTYDPISARWLIRIDGAEADDDEIIFEESQSTTPSPVDDAVLNRRDFVAPRAQATNQSNGTAVTGWTDERIERLIAMWNDGASANQIAQELGGVSRNAVIGKAHRLRLEVRSSTAS